MLNQNMVIGKYFMSVSFINLIVEGIKLTPDEGKSKKIVIS